MTKTGKWFLIFTNIKRPLLENPEAGGVVILERLVGGRRKSYRVRKLMFDIHILQALALIDFRCFFGRTSFGKVE
jgi:hypothetical protein